MGINKLLPHISGLVSPRLVKDLSGQVAGIDGHVWLHRSLLRRFQRDPKGVSMRSHIDFFLRRSHELNRWGIKPVFVFDGADLPAKLGTKQARRIDRAANMARGISLREIGEHSPAALHFAKATHVTFALVHALVLTLRANGIDAFVAPYEADAQLSWLAKSGLIDFVISEDSDLLIYGCPRVLFKLDFGSGFGLEVTGPVRRASAFSSLNDELVTFACVLAGCDYFENVRGVGLKTAMNILRKFQHFSTDLQTLTESVCDSLIEVNPHSGNERLRLIKDLRTAVMVFRHQTVYNPVSGSLESVTKPDFDLIDLEEYMIGSSYEPEIATGVYHGSRHPVTKATLTRNIHH